MTEQIGRSRKQRVFAILEDTKGTLKFPAAANIIAPAGNAVMNQSPTFVDSLELSDSLDVIDRFQNALPAGTWSVPTYVRPSGTIGSVPQGDALWQSMQGGKSGTVTAALNAGIDSNDDSFVYKSLAGGILPEIGVVTIGTEKILYTSIVRTTATTGTCSGCVRGYNGTTAASHLADAAITANHIFYRQDTESPSFSLWIQTDFMVQGMSGCSVNQVTAGITNTGALSFEFSGQGMKMCWAGYDTVYVEAASGQKTIVVSHSERFSVGSRIWNKTKEDDNSGAGYEIDSVNYSTDTITVTSNLQETWEAADEIEGFLLDPDTDAEIGDPIESRLASISFDGVAAKFKTSDLTFNVPKEYLVDEVGTTQPEQYVENTREITSNLKLYLNHENVGYFGLGFEGNESKIKMVFGDEAGSIMAIILPRVSLEVPAIAATAPTIELTVPIKALGTAGEDSCEIVFH